MNLWIDLLDCHLSVFIEHQFHHSSRVHCIKEFWWNVFSSISFNITHFYLYNACNIIFKQHCRVTFNKGESIWFLNMLDHRSYPYTFMTCFMNCKNFLMIWRCGYHCLLDWSPRYCCTTISKYISCLRSSSMGIWKTSCICIPNQLQFWFFWII